MATGHQSNTTQPNVTDPAPPSSIHWS
jgi:hypothetical protein